MRVHRVFASFSLLALAACNISSGDDAATPTGPSVPDRGDNAPSSSSGSPGSIEASPAPTTPGAPGTVLDEGAVFTISNAADSNEVLAFARDAGGKLVPAGVYPTGGRGSGAGLGSQGALALSADGKVLVVVDAGSNQISSFAVDGPNLQFRSRVSSGGTMPIGVAVHGSLVYALNAGQPSNVSGFRLSANGVLTAISSSTRSLSAATAAPGQVSFNPNGDVLVVTEKNTDTIDTFVVTSDGTPSLGEAIASSGKTPFGFAFAPTGELVVSEAFGGMPGLGATSTYVFDKVLHAGAKGGAERGIAARSTSIANGQTAPCWAVVTKDGRFAYTSNTPSGTISAYALASDGKLALVGDGAAMNTGDGSRPLDMTLDRSSMHLYVLNGGTRRIKVLDVAVDGSLTGRPEGSPELPATAFGLIGF
jgi:6-phosphogluconolactonase (cycloisomerase 2 family)